MHEDSRSELQDLHSRVIDEESRTQELRFEGFGVRNDDLSKAKVNFPLERHDSRVSSNGGARYKTLSPARLPIAARSPCFTIPAGMSPGTLLESPVFLTNVEAEPSPTTGTFSMPLNMDDNATSDTLSSSGDSSSNSTYDEGSSGDFEFKPRIRSYASLSGALASVGSKQQQFEPSLQDQSQCQTSASCLIRPEKTEVSLHELTLCATTPNPSIEIDTSRASAHAEVASHELQQEQGSNNGIQVSEISNRQKAPLVAVENFTEDGYNWRKYGQKHVKGSEFPRSYYKCTHPNCQMKKQLERSHDGQIIDVTYKGRHDHPKPQPSRRLAAGVVLSYQGEERPYEFSSLGSVEDKLSNAHGPTSHNIDQNGTLELSPVSASDDDIEGIGRQSNNVGDHVVVDDKSESKRRKIDDCSVDVIQVGKPREPRVVVQTLSEVDILDDGYRWRKYGQKVVKGNPNPRSYYKCTNTGCPVRKHVERAPHDPKAVITTYEGKHNHDVPALRTSCHDTAAPVIVSDVSSLNTMPGAMNVKLTFDSMLTTSRQAEECETISLDLGVGISPRQDHRDNQKLQNPKEPVQNSIISACYVSPNNSMDYFGSREDNGENFCFKTANLKHSSHPYEANMGGLIMEP